MIYPTAALLVSPNSPWRITVANQKSGEYAPTYATNPEHWAELLNRGNFAFAAIEIRNPPELLPAARLILNCRSAGLVRGLSRIPIFALATSRLTFATAELVAVGCTWVCTEPERFQSLAAKAVEIAAGSSPPETTVGEVVDGILPWKRHGQPRFVGDYNVWKSTQAQSAG